MYTKDKVVLEQEQMNQADPSKKKAISIPMLDEATSELKAFPDKMSKDLRHFMGAYRTWWIFLPCINNDLRLQRD